MLAALQNKYKEQAVIKASLYKVIDAYLRTGSEMELQQFLEKIQALNVVWYKDANVYLKRQ